MINDRLKVMFKSLKDDWETPQEVFDSLNSEFGFTLDVCSSDHNAKCTKYFTPKDDGLSKDWSNDVCFMNPPYGRVIGKWIEKAHKESLKGAIVVCLIPARTDTIWWHKWVMLAEEIRLVKGRLKFGNSKNMKFGKSNSAPFPSAIVIFKHSIATDFTSATPTFVSQEEFNMGLEVPTSFPPKSSPKEMTSPNPNIPRLRPNLNFCSQRLK